MNWLENLGFRPWAEKYIRISDPFLLPAKAEVIGQEEPRMAIPRLMGHTYRVRKGESNPGPLQVHFAVFLQDALPPIVQRGIIDDSSRARPLCFNEGAIFKEYVGTHRQVLKIVKADLEAKVSIDLGNTLAIDIIGSEILVGCSTYFPRLECPLEDHKEGIRADLVPLCIGRGRSITVLTYRN